MWVVKNSGQNGQNCARPKAGPLGRANDEPQHKRDTLRQAVGQEEEVHEEQGPLRPDLERREDRRKRRREGTIHSSEHFCINN